MQPGTTQCTFYCICASSTINISLYVIIQHWSISSETFPLIHQGFMIRPFMVFFHLKMNLCTPGISNMFMQKHVDFLINLSTMIEVYKQIPGQQTQTTLTYDIRINIWLGFNMDRSMITKGACVDTHTCKH